MKALLAAVFVYAVLLWIGVFLRAAALVAVVAVTKTRSPHDD